MSFHSLLFRSKSKSYGTLREVKGVAKLHVLEGRSLCINYLVLHKIYHLSLSFNCYIIDLHHIVNIVSILNFHWVVL